MGKANLRKSFWAYVLEIVVYILKRVSSKSVDVTLYKIWNNRKPYISHMKVWGYPAYMKRILLDKLDAKSDKCLLINAQKVLF